MNAKQQHEQRLLEIKQQLQNIQLKLDDISSSSKIINWGDVGDLGAVLEQLQKTNSFLR